MRQTTTARSRAKVAVLALFISIAISLLQLTPAMAIDPAAGRTVLGAGAHVDAIYPQLTGKTFEVKSLTPDGVKDTDKIALHIPTTKTSHVGLPEGYEFLGKKGTKAWVSTEAQDKSVVWPGWSFEGLESKDLKGTIKINYKNFSYAGDSASPRFAVTQPGGFDGKKVTPLIVPGTTHTGVSGEAGAHTHATWTFTAAGTYDIKFGVEAELADGTPVADDVTVRFIVGETGDNGENLEAQKDPQPSDAVDKLTIEPAEADAEYFTGQDADLNAVAPGARKGDSYRWFTTAPGESKAVKDPEQNTEEFSTKAIRALDGTKVHVERVGADGKVVERSEPVTIGTRTKTPTTSLSVKPDKRSYHAGETATFSSTQTPKTEDEHYHWYLKLPGQDEYEWIPESRRAEQSLKITPEMDGALITARLFNADHAILAEAPVQQISVDGGEAAADSFKVSSNQKSAKAGQKVSFTADLPSDDKVEWSVRKQGENVYAPIKGSTGKTRSTEMGKDWDGAEVRAVVRNGKTVISEGSFPAVSVDQASEAAASSEQEATSSTWILPVGIVVAVIIIAGAVILVVRRRASVRKETGSGAGTPDDTDTTTKD